MDGQRRSLLKRMIQGVCGLGAAALTGVFLLPPRVRDLSRRVALGPVSALPLGSTLHLAAHDVHLFHSAGGLHAISGKCTHLGCSVELQPDGFSCPCHGARFDLAGQPLSGPAPRHLSWYRLSVDAGRNAWLYLDEPVPAGTYTRV